MKYDKPVGISILTNADRLPWLRRCLEALLNYCHYRPLAIGIFSNGSTDDTAAWVRHLDVTPHYGITYKNQISTTDIGCAAGTNRAMSLVADCQYALHIESDFIHLPPEISGVDQYWLHRAIDLMETGDCDYLYLRRMTSPREMMMHFWSQWMPQVVEERGEYLRCPPFWFSQNPHLRRVEALIKAGTLPMREYPNDHKGSPVWNRSEMESPKPPNPWLHRWGVFVHELNDELLAKMSMGMTCRYQAGKYGTSPCKYGYYLLNGGLDGRWCTYCAGPDFHDMKEHDARWRRGM